MGAWKTEAVRDVRRLWAGESLAVDSARKLAFAGVFVNLIVLAFPGVGTIALFQRQQSLLTLLGLDASLSWIIVVVLFAAYVAIGVIAPIVALQRLQPRRWYAAPLVLFAGGAMTFVSIGGMLLVIAGVLLIWAGPDEAYRSPQPPEADVAESLRDHLHQPRPAATCPICGTVLRADQNTCPACTRRSTIRG